MGAYCPGVAQAESREGRASLAKKGMTVVGKDVIDLFRLFCYINLYIVSRYRICSNPVRRRAAGVAPPERVIFRRREADPGGVSSGGSTER